MQNQNLNDIILCNLYLGGIILDFSEELKEKVIEYYIYSRLKLNEIIEKVQPYGELTMEDILKILEEYQNKIGTKIVRKGFSKTTIEYADKIPDEKIKELAEKGYSNKKIAKFFTDQGYTITHQNISYRKRKIYRDNLDEMPTYKKILEERRAQRNDELLKRKKEETQKNEEINSIIYDLRENKKTSFKNISTELRNKGIHIAPKSIKKKCEIIYDEKGEELYKLKTGGKIRIIVDREKLFNLREAGCTTNELSEIFETTQTTITNMLEEIYKEKGMEQPYSKTRLYGYIDVPMDEIVELNRFGLSDFEISEYLKSKKIDISRATVRKKLNKEYIRLGEKAPRLNNGQSIKTIRKMDLKHVKKEDLKEIMCYIRNTKHATEEQIRDLYEYYGLEYEEYEEDKEKDER